MTDSPSTAVHHVFGMDTSIKRNTITYGETDSNEDDLYYLAGKCIVKLNVKTKERTFAMNSDSRFSCMTTSEDIIYVGETGLNSSILICSLPHLKILGRLLGGSEIGYSCLDVSKDGKLLCSVGIKPDHSLIVWDLEKMSIILRTKACGQEVYNASFSPHNRNIITTAGKGHIKFWNMANTFTGLKLQGKYGKFGKVDVCSIQSFLHLRDGRVLSASDSGYLFLWEDGFLKLTFGLGHVENVQGIKAKLPIHQGGVNHLFHDEKNQHIISTGADGCIRWWDYHGLTANGCGEFDTHRTIHPRKELFLHDSSNISFFVTVGFKDLIAQDANGKVFMVDTEEDSISLLEDFHKGNIVDIGIFPTEHICVTCGKDGSIRCCNFLLKQIICSIQFPLQCTKIAWCPKKLDKAERSFVVGFSDGSIKILCLSADKILVLQSVRPHKSSIKLITFSPCGNLLASSDDTGAVFLFKCKEMKGIDEVFTPIGFFHCCEESIVSSIRWLNDKTILQYVNTNGTPFEIDLTTSLMSLGKGTNNIRQTYRFDVCSKRLETANNHSFLFRRTDECTGSLNKDSFDGKFTIQTQANGVVMILFSNEDRPCRDFSHKNTPPPHGENVGSSTQSHIFDNFHLVNPQKQVSEKYTLEELLQKKVTDATYNAAAKKKKNIRRTITDLKTDLINIRQLNSSLPLNTRLPPCELLMHSFFTVMYKEMLQREIKDLLSKHSIDTESCRTKRLKLERVFANDTETGFEVVSSLKGRYTVQSFPLLKLVESSFIALRNSLTSRSNTKKQNPTPNGSYPTIQPHSPTVIDKHQGKISKSQNTTDENRKVRNIPTKICDRFVDS